MRAKMMDYLSNRWNIVDLCAIITYFVGFALRVYPSTLKFGHLILALNVGIWVLRLLHVFYVHRVMGPYVVMIYRMVQCNSYLMICSVIFLYLLRKSQQYNEPFTRWPSPRLANTCPVNTQYWFDVQNVESTSK